jgi:hypothetical protein
VTETRRDNKGQAAKACSPLDIHEIKMVGICGKCDSKLERVVKVSKTKAIIHKKLCGG